jgi:hypothetical protein
MKKKGIPLEYSCLMTKNIQIRSPVLSICDFGMKSKVLPGKITICITKSHPLILLAETIPWQEMFELIFPNLKNTTKKGKWWLGRKLKVRIHLGAYVLQQLYNLTDRDTEYNIRDNAAYQIFCGQQLMDKWHVPDHTKIEDFRSRLCPETQRQLANLITIHAVKLGLADPKDLDIDSTVQEANMTYPTDAKMLRKLGLLAEKVSKSLKGILPNASYDLMVDIKGIALNARNCFFQKRYSSKEDKAENLQQLWESVTEPLARVIKACNSLTAKQADKLKWNITKAKTQVIEYGEAYLAAAKIFIDTGKAIKDKRLSFHLSEVECFSKGKAHKKHEFGRAFQLGRIGGNFMFVGACTSVRMDDKKAVVPMLAEHEKLFGVKTVDSLATDKGYYSKKNIKHAQEKGIAKIGIQQPCTVNKKIAPLSPEDEETLYNRRSGIEPLIGHVKQGGQLGRSRMKSDSTIESSGYTSVLGFNLRQTIKAKFKMAA